MLKSTYTAKPYETGTDEAGRGCLAGPVTAAAVMLPEGFKNILLNDSKLLAPSQRNELRMIIEDVAICFSVCHVDHLTIDRINILNASIQAMHSCLDGLSTLPSFVIVDGNRFHLYKDIDHQCIIKGDSKYLSIAAASILAKTHRDDHMRELHDRHPEYNWKQNKGYPTLEHRRAIAQYGVTTFHRLSFRLLPEIVCSI